MDFRVGPSLESPRDFLSREALLFPGHTECRWERVVTPGFLPVVLVKNQISEIPIIAHCKRKLEELLDPKDTRQKTVYLISVEKLLSVAGKDFIEFAKDESVITFETFMVYQQKEEENLKKLKELLFSGKPGVLGGLSNEEALARACPVEFKSFRNGWSSLAMNIFYHGGDLSHWRFKNKDNASKQFSCFEGLIHSFGLSHEDKQAVAGWMLSEMLEELPEYLPISD